MGAQLTPPVSWPWQSVSTPDPVERLDTLRQASHEMAAAMEAVVTADRIQRRLGEIDRAAQDAGQFGPAVRAEQLLGKSVGMVINRSRPLSGKLNDGHVQSLLELARKRQAEPVEFEDGEP